MSRINIQSAVFICGSDLTDERRKTMYFTDDSLFPENMQPTIITAAPFGPEWLPGDVEDLPLTWDQQVQAAVDCYNAGATVLHFHVRDPRRARARRISTSTTSSSRASGRRCRR